MTNHSGLLRKATYASIEGGAAILEVYKTAFAVEMKEDKSPLTEADKRCNDIIVAALENTGIEILSEEGRDIPYNERSSWPKFWLVDPLDGTKEFIKKNGEFTVNIALISADSPIMGVIFVPVKERLYFGLEGKGSFKLENATEELAALANISDEEEWMKALCAKCDGLPVAQDRDKIVIVGSRSHMNDETRAFIEEQQAIHGEVEMISCGSSLKICEVAEGNADMYPRFAPTMEWDTGAGDAIARFSGASVIKVESQTPLVYNKENLLNPWFLVKRETATKA